MARLHSATAAPPAARRPGGAWHHLVLDAGLPEEIDSITSLLHAAHHRVPASDGHLYHTLAEDLSRVEDFAHMPRAFSHADLVPRNFVISSKGDTAVVDWTGAGWFPRISSLGCLLWSAANSPACIRSALAGYRTGIQLEPLEIERLEFAMRTRPLVLACWSFATGRMALAEAVSYWEGIAPWWPRSNPRPRRPQAVIGRTNQAISE